MLLINLTDGAGFIIYRQPWVILLTHTMRPCFYSREVEEKERVLARILHRPRVHRPSDTIKHAQTKRDKGEYLSRQTSSLVH